MNLSFYYFANTALSDLSISFVDMPFLLATALFRMYYQSKDILVNVLIE